MCQILCQDIVLTMFRDAHTDEQEKNRYTSSHITLGGGIKTNKSYIPGVVSVETISSDYQWFYCSLSSRMRAVLHKMWTTRFWFLNVFLNVLISTLLLCHSSDITRLPATAISWTLQLMLPYQLRNNNSNDNNNNNLIACQRSDNHLRLGLCHGSHWGSLCHPQKHRLHEPWPRALDAQRPVLQSVRDLQIIWPTPLS